MSSINSRIFIVNNKNAVYYNGEPFVDLKHRKISWTIMKNLKYIFISKMFCLLLFVMLQNGQNVSAQMKMSLGERDFNVAAAENNKLQYSLQWSLGKKTQTGWNLYVPLIQHTLNTNAEVDDTKFAEAVFEWQKENKIAADGIIDNETLFSFITFWQSRRIKPVIQATDDLLLTAPISNFFDPTRDIELLKVEKETFKAYKKMLKAAVADKSLGLKVDREGNLIEEEKFLKMISTYRSPEYQAGLRKKQPNASRAQIAFVSPHFTGRALDIYVGGEPVTTRDDNRAIQIKTPAYLWLVKNAGKFGFYPYFYEPWHWEYVPQNLGK